MTRTYYLSGAAELAVTCVVMRGGPRVSLTFGVEHFPTHWVVEDKILADVILCGRTNGADMARALRAALSPTRRAWITRWLGTIDWGV